LTENTDADVMQAALRDGVQGYVLKTDAGRELLLTMEAVLRGEKVLSERLQG
jgi:DNA-binding NarL/FixJ family response regulator